MVSLSNHPFILRQAQDERDIFMRISWIPAFAGTTVVWNDGCLGAGAGAKSMPITISAHGEPDPLMVSLSNHPFILRQAQDERRVYYRAFPASPQPLPMR